MWLVKDLTNLRFDTGDIIFIFASVRSVILFLVCHLPPCWICFNFPPTDHFDSVAYSKTQCQLSEMPSENNTGVIYFVENEQWKCSLMCDGLGLMRIAVCDCRVIIAGQVLELWGSAVFPSPSCLCACFSAGCGWQVLFGLLLDARSQTIKTRPLLQFKRTSLSTQYSSNAHSSSMW